MFAGVGWDAILAAAMPAIRKQLAAEILERVTDAVEDWDAGFASGMRYAATIVEEGADGGLLAEPARAVPTQITTVEDLDALPNWTVIRTTGTEYYRPRVLEKCGLGWLLMSGGRETSRMISNELPAEVLFRPDQGLLRGPTPARDVYDTAAQRIGTGET